MNKLKSYFIVILVALLFFYTFGLNNIFNALSQFFITSFHLSPSQVGFVSSLFFYGNIIFLVPAGLIVDRVSPKKLLPIIMILCATFTVFMGFTGNIVLMSIARFLTGVCAAFGFVGCVRVAANIMDKKQLSKATGIIVTLGMLGGFAAQAPLTYLIEKTSWQTGLITVGIIGYIIAILIYFALRNTHYALGKLQLTQSILQKLKIVFLNLQNILCAAYTSLMNLPIYMLGAMWGIPYLVSVGNYSQTQAATISGMLFLGTMIGSPITGAISDFYKSRKGIMIVGAIISILVMLIILHVKTDYYTDLFLFLLLGMVTSTQILSYPVVVENNPTELSGSATSVISIISLLGGAIIQPLFGIILVHFSVNNVINGYSYSTAIKCLLVAFAIAAVVGLFIKKHGGES